MPEDRTGSLISKYNHLELLWRSPTWKLAMNGNEWPWMAWSSLLSAGYMIIMIHLCLSQMRLSSGTHWLPYLEENLWRLEKFWETHLECLISIVTRWGHFNLGFVEGKSKVHNLSIRTCFGPTEQANSSKRLTPLSPSLWCNSLLKYLHPKSTNMWHCLQNLRQTQTQPTRHVASSACGLQATFCLDPKCRNGGVWKSAELCQWNSRWIHPP